MFSALPAAGVREVPTGRSTSKYVCRMGLHCRIHTGVLPAHGGPDPLQHGWSEQMAFLVWKTLLRDQTGVRPRVALRRAQGLYGSGKEARHAARAIAAGHRFSVYKAESDCWIAEAPDRSTYLISIGESPLAADTA